MLNITINKTEYKVCCSFDNITIEQAINLIALYKDAPEQLKTFYKAVFSNNEDELKKAKTNIKTTALVEYSKFYKKVIQLLSNVPDEVLDKCMWSEITALYKTYLETLLLGVMFTPKYESKGITQFEHNGTVYHFPHFTKGIDGDIPMGGISAIEFTESVDLQIASIKADEGQYKYCTNIIAILCRPEGEKYEEQVCVQRAKEFLKLPFSIAIELFFCLNQQQTLLSQHAQIYLLQTKKTTLHEKQQSLAGTAVLSRYQKNSRKRQKKLKG